MLIDLNHKSGFVYGSTSVQHAAIQINALIDSALVAERQSQPPRTYLGASRIGEPCSRRLAFEYSATPPDAGKDIDGQTSRIFQTGHLFETLSIRWLRSAGFDLRTAKTDGSQFGFSTANGRFRGHIDGVIVAGPDIGISWPVLWENKSVNAKAWNDLVKRGLAAAKPLYYAQIQIYMAYMEVEHSLFTAVNKDTQELFHELVSFDARHAQELSDKAVAIIRAVEAHELPPRIADAPDYYLCRFCFFSHRCWKHPS